MSGRFHANNDRIPGNVQPFKQRKQLSATLLCVGNCDAVKQRLPLGVDDRRFMVALSYVDPAVKQQKSEIGIVMTQFRTADAIASWAGLVPECNESADKKKVLDCEKVTNNLSLS